MPLVPAATLALLFGAILWAGAASGTVGLAVAVAVAQAALAVSWVLATSLPGRVGAVVIGLAAAAASDATVLRWYEHGYESALSVLGLALPVMFCHQLMRGVVRNRVVESLSGLAILLLGICSASGLLLLIRQGEGRHQVMGVVAAICAAVLVSCVIDAVLARPRFDPTVNRGLLGLIAGVLAGAAAGYLPLRTVADLTGQRALAAAALTAAVACLLSVGASFTAAGAARVPKLWIVLPVAGVLMTLCLSVPAGYVLVTGLAS